MTALLNHPNQLQDFTLITDQGEINLADYRGKLVLLYFGYTFCPDAPRPFLKYPVR